MHGGGSSGSFVLGTEDIHVPGRGHGTKKKRALADHARSLQVLGIDTGKEGDWAEVLDCDYHNCMEVDGAGNNLTGQGGDTAVGESSSVRGESTTERACPGKVTRQ